MSAQNNSYQSPERLPFSVPPNYYPNYMMQYYPGIGPPFGHPFPSQRWPRMWTSNDTYYRYPDCFADPSDQLVTDHSTNCCISGNICSGAGDKTFADAGQQSALETSDRSVQTNPQPEDNAVDKLEELVDKLMDAKMAVLDSNQRLITRAVDSHTTCLQAIGSYVKKESQRFADRKDICDQLKTFEENIANALGKAADVRREVLDNVSLQKEMIVKDVDHNYDLTAFHYELDAFPDLLDFYSNILDEMPTKVADKQQVNEGMQNKSNLQEMNRNWKDFGGDQLEVKQEVPKNFSKLGTTFPGDHYPIIQLPCNGGLEPIEEQPNARVGREPNTLPDYKSPPSAKLHIPSYTAPTFKPIPPKVDTAPPKTTTCVPSAEQYVFEPRMSTQDRNRSTYVSSATLFNDSVSQMSAQQKRIVEILSETFPNASKQTLFDDMIKTREMMIQFGKKGFTGKKFPEIVAEVISFIESKNAAKRSVVANVAQRNVCIICKAQVMTIEERLLLSCGHCFHDHCIKHWAKCHDYCPECKTTIRGIHHLNAI